MENGQITFKGWFYAGFFPIALGFFLKDFNIAFGMALIALGAFVSFLTVRMYIRGPKSPQKPIKRKSSHFDKDIEIVDQNSPSSEFSGGLLGGSGHYSTWDQNNNHLHFNKIIGADPNNNHIRFGRGAGELWVDYESKKNGSKAPKGRRNTKVSSKSHKFNFDYYNKKR